MGDSYERQTKLNYAKDIVSHMNQTIHDLNLPGALRTFGQSAWPISKRIALVFGLLEYSKLSKG